jgi:hypothetical protein
MKILLFLTLLVIGLSSCGEATIHPKSLGHTYESGSVQPKDIEEIEVDGCQYIGSFSGSGDTNWGTHKGTCTNPIHNQNHVTVVDTVEYQLIRK